MKLSLQNDGSSDDGPTHDGTRWSPPHGSQLPNGAGRADVIAIPDGVAEDAAPVHAREGAERRHGPDDDGPWRADGTWRAYGTWGTNGDGPRRTDGTWGTHGTRRTDGRTHEAGHGTRQDARAATALSSGPARAARRDGEPEPGVASHLLANVLAGGDDALSAAHGEQPWNAGLGRTSHLTCPGIKELARLEPIQSRSKCSVRLVTADWSEKVIHHYTSDFL